MTKKVLSLFTLITLAACLFSYKVGSAPVALAKARPSPQETADSATALTLPAAPATWALWTGGGNAVQGPAPPLPGAHHALPLPPPPLLHTPPAPLTPLPLI